MSHATTTPAAGGPAPGATPRLSSARLPRWTPWVVALGSVAAGCAAGLAAGLSSKVQWGLIAGLLFVVANFALTARVQGRRQARDRLATSLVWASFVLALIPLLSLLWVTVERGLKVLDGYFLSHSMGVIADAETGGGIYHAIVGTLEQVGLATLMAVPIGLLTAVYLVEYGTGKLAKAVTFFVDVMTGIPSIVAGLFIFSFWIMILGFQPSGFAGALALAILMMPVVVRSTEEMLKLVPNELREASLALGVPKWRTILKVVL
ncbi:PstA family ABC transporter permease, partial [Streptomyces sampsonii]